MNYKTSIHAIGDVLPHAVQAISSTVIHEEPRVRNIECPCFVLTWLYITGINFAGTNCSVKVDAVNSLALINEVHLYSIALVSSNYRPRYCAIEDHCRIHDSAGMQIIVWCHLYYSFVTY